MGTVNLSEAKFGNSFSDAFEKTSSIPLGEYGVVGELQWLAYASNYEYKSVVKDPRLKAAKAGPETIRVLIKLVDEMNADPDGYKLFIKRWSEGLSPHDVTQVLRYLDARMRAILPAESVVTAARVREELSRTLSVLFYCVEDLKLIQLMMTPYMLQRDREIEDMLSTENLQTIYDYLQSDDCLLAGSVDDPGRWYYGGDSYLRDPEFSEFDEDLE